MALSLHYRRQDRQAGREARKTPELRSENGTPRVPGVAAPQGAVITARQTETTSRQRDAVWLGAGLAAVTRALRNRDFHQHVIVGVVVLTALGRMALEGLGRSVRALVAWDNARLAELNEQLRRKREAETSQPTAS
jgi:hypothetical protein